MAIQSLAIFCGSKTGAKKLYMQQAAELGKILAENNVLFHGEVLEKEIKGKTAKAIQAFNDYLLARTDVEKMILPLRDGLMIIRKI